MNDKNTKKNELYYCPCCGWICYIPKELECHHCSEKMILTEYHGNWELENPIYKIRKRNEIRNKIIIESPLFDIVKWNKRVIKEKDHDYVRIVDSIPIMSKEVYKTPATIKQNNKLKKISSPIAKCPKCGSQSISTNRRGWKITVGLLGSSKMINTCQVCGYQWKPGK